MSLYDSTNDFREDLERYGELHITLACGDKYELHNHDVMAHGSGRIDVNSKEGRWWFRLEDVEDARPDHSKKK